MLQQKHLQQTIDYLLLSILLVFPFSFYITITSDEVTHPIFSINLSFADIIIATVFLLWLIKIIVCNQIKEIKLPPLPVILFIVFALISILNAFSITEWAKEFIKVIEYFIIFYILLINNLKTVRLFHILNVIFIITTVILLTAFIQSYIFNGSPYLIRGLFENRNILGSYICIVLPLVFTAFLYTPLILKKIWYFLILLLSFLVLLSGNAIISIGISLAVVNLFLPKNKFFQSIAVLIILVTTSSIIIPKENIKALKDHVSFWEEGSISQNYYKRLSLVADLQRTIVLKETVGDKKLLSLSTSLFMSDQLPEPVKGSAYKDLEGKSNVKNRYLEMQSALNLVSKNTLLGVGLGNYQNNIGSYYNNLPKVNTAEPNQVNTFLVIGATTGVLGLSSFLFFLFLSLKTAYKNFRMSNSEMQELLYLGLLGCISSIVVEGMFSMLINLGLMVPLIYVLYLPNSQIKL